MIIQLFVEILQLGGYKNYCMSFLNKIQIFNKDYRKYFFNTFWLLTGDLSNRLAGIIMGVFLARYLGPANLGLLTYIDSYVSLFLIFATLGLPNILIASIVKEPEADNEILGTSFILSIFGGFFGIVLMVVINMFLKNDFITTLMIVIFSSNFIFRVFDIIDVFFQAKIKTVIGVYSRFFAILLQIIFTFLLVWFRAPFIWFIIPATSYFLVKSLFLLMYYYREGYSLKKWEFSKIRAVSLLKDTWPLLVSGFFTTIYLEIDQVMVREMLNDYSAGIYSVASRLSKVWFFIPSAITLSLFPSIIAAKKHSQELYRKRLQQLYDIVSWLSIIVAVGIIFFGKAAITIIFGKEYISAHTVLLVYIWSSVFAALSIAREKWIIIESFQKYYLYFTIGGCLINVVFNYIFIPICGISGAAFATLIAYFTSTFIGPLFFKETRKSIMDLLNVFNISRLVRTYFINVFFKSS